MLVCLVAAVVSAASMPSLIYTTRRRRSRRRPPREQPFSPDQTLRCARPPHALAARGLVRRLGHRLLVAEQVLAVDAVVEERHVGCVPLRLVLVEHCADLEALWALGGAALQRRVRLEVLRLAGLLAGVSLVRGKLACPSCRGLPPTLHQSAAPRGFAAVEKASKPGIAPAAPPHSPRNSQQVILVDTRRPARVGRRVLRILAVAALVQQHLVQVVALASVLAHPAGRTRG